jgi:transcriptional regulator
MYTPTHFQEPRLEVLHHLIRTHPLATVVTLSDQGLDANHIPFVLSPQEGPYGTLRCHVARANPIWKEATQAAMQATETLLIFHGPQAYISPSWYPSKAETGKVVPTWNYAVVHAHGKMRVVDDPVWLRSQLEAITRQNESAMLQPWQVKDAPADYIEKMMAAVVGIEIPITRLTGKWKVSQNQPEQNRAGVVDGLGRMGEAGQTMAAWVKDASA